MAAERATMTAVVSDPVLVRISGAASGKAKRTSAKGTVVLRVRGMRKGNVTFRAEKRGYAPTGATLKVR